MAEKTLKRMTKEPVRVATFEEAIANINIVKAKHDEIIQIRDSLDEGGLLSKTIDAHSEVTRMYSEINEYHKKIFPGDETLEAIKSEVEKLVKNFHRDYHEGMKKVRREMHGYNRRKQGRRGGRTRRIY